MDLTLSNTNISQLEIVDLRLFVHLGCSKEERFNPQPISVNIKLLFSTPPRGTVTDDLKDTICYKEIIDLLQNIIKDKDFNLIEHLAAIFYDTIKAHLMSKEYDDLKLEIKVNKLCPPVAGILGGVTFTYSG